MNTNVNNGNNFDLIGRIKPGSNVSEVMSISDCKVLRLSDKTGDGMMTIYQVFDGIYLMYDDFHLRECESAYQAAETVFCIDHCREGSMEQYFTEDKAFRMNPGNVKLDTRVHHKGKTIFPNCHFHGITIGFEEKLSQNSINEFAPKTDINLEELAKKFCPDNTTSIFDEDKTFEAIIFPLYHLTGHIDLDYIRVKILEILIFLKNWNPKRIEETENCIFADQAARIRGIHEFLIKNIDENYSQEYLASHFGMTKTAMKKGFKQIYGESIHAYLKAFRIQQAALMLKDKSNKAISEIALSLGYSSHSKFSAAFKEQFKMTPQEYRNQNQIHTE